MLQSLCVGLSERIYGLSMGQGGRASAERRTAAGHLKNVICLSNKWWGKQQTFHLVDFA
jgi:hypothetical protein